MNEFLKSIIDGINSVVGNYGWSIMIFTLLLKLVLTPFDYKSRVGMRKMSKLQPQVAKLQQKYKNDQEKLNQKTSELYRKEKVNPLSSCLPMLLSMPILFAMFAAMRMIANEQMIQQVFDILQGNEPTLVPWLWIKNVWMPDSPFSPSWPDLSLLQQIPADIWLKMFNNLQAADPAAYEAIIASVAQGGSFALDPAVHFASTSEMQNAVRAIVATMQTMPDYAANVANAPGWHFNLLIASFDLKKNFNGLFILPLFSAVSQYLMTVLQNKQQPQTPVASNDPKAQQQQSTSKFMQWFFPLFSLWICAGYNAAFALYWCASNIIAIAQNFIINWYLDKKDREAAVAAGNLQK